MPIYEFYCADCHTIYSFLARAPDTRKRPHCPRCGRSELERRASVFAISRGRAEPTPEGEIDGMDEGKLEQAVAELARDAEGLDDDDPRQLARLMRKLYDGTGMSLGPGMEEAMRRMEAGEDPDKIEQEMGDLLETEEPFVAGGRSLERLRRRLRPAAVDETLYEL